MVGKKIRRVVDSGNRGWAVTGRGHERTFWNDAMLLS